MVNMSYNLDPRSGRNLPSRATRQLFVRRARDAFSLSPIRRFGPVSRPPAATRRARTTAPERPQPQRQRYPLNARQLSLTLSPRAPSPAPPDPNAIPRIGRFGLVSYPPAATAPAPPPAPAQPPYSHSQMQLPINIRHNYLSLTLPPRVTLPTPRQFRSPHIINPPRRSPPDHLPSPLFPTSRQRAHPRAREITNLPSVESVEAYERVAAYAAVDAHFGNAPGYVGIGSGSTVSHVVDRIRQLPAERIRNTAFVPTGHESRELLRNAGFRVARLEDVPGRISVAFDGADEVDRWLNCVKGGGGCLLLEKLVAIRSEVFIVVADPTKRSPTLLTSYRRGIPVEVIPSATPDVLSELRALGSTDPRVRDGAPANLGPCITDNGNFIVDAPFPPLATSRVIIDLAKSLKGIVGVVEHGIFWRGDRRPEQVFFGRRGEGLERVEVNLG